MPYRVVLLNRVAGQTEFTTDTLDIENFMIVKGRYRTPISNIKYIEELG